MISAMSCHRAARLSSLAEVSTSSGAVESGFVVLVIWRAFGLGLVLGVAAVLSPNSATEG